MKKIVCRKGCGACCVAPSITTPMPGMPEGKPAGVRCIHLTKENLCSLFGKTERPDVCVSYAASEEFCGRSPDEAIERISVLERITK